MATSRDLAAMYMEAPRSGAPMFTEIARGRRSSAPEEKGSSSRSTSPQRCTSCQRVRNCGDGCVNKWVAVPTPTRSTIAYYDQRIVYSWRNGEHLQRDRSSDYLDLSQKHHRTFYPSPKKTRFTTISYLSRIMGVLWLLCHTTWVVISSRSTGLYPSAKLAFAL